MQKRIWSHLLGVLCRSPYVLLALLMWEIKGQGLERDILLGNKCSTEPPEATEPKIHVFNETSKERWWHRECPADYSVKLEPLCVSTHSFSVLSETESGIDPEFPRLVGQLGLQQMPSFILVQSIPYRSGRGRIFYFVFINKYVQIWVLEVIL